MAKGTGSPNSSDGALIGTKWLQCKYGLVDIVDIRGFTVDPLKDNDNKPTGGWVATVWVYSDADNWFRYDEYPSHEMAMAGVIKAAKEIALALSEEE